MIWHIVTKYARQTGLVDKLAPHDMRRTCAKLCRESGGDLKQIQFLLGHASIQTMERYLGTRQNLKEPLTIGWDSTLIDKCAGRAYGIPFVGTFSHCAAEGTVPIVNIAATSETVLLLIVASR